LRERILQFARQIDVLNLRRHLAHYILPSKSKRFGAAANASISRINWERTKAYSPLGSVYGAIFLDKNSPGYQSLRDEIATKLRSLRNIKNGDKIVKALYFAEEIYKGEHILGGPDIIVEPEEDYTFAAPALIAHDKIVMDIGFELEIPGGHHSDGILIWDGEGVKKANQINCNIMDIAPTILARLGITIPHHMDGTVLDPIFSEPLSKKYTTWEGFQYPTRDSDLNSDDQALNQRLRDLGYL
jgi:predicted AlkP superfamily phosphohydrolase/phosphomutase